MQIERYIEKSEAANAIRRAKEWALRSYLPYGIWTTEDGREVLFNRGYVPIWERSREQKIAVPANPREWVKKIATQDWFYDDSNAPYGERPNKRSLMRCVRVLRDWGVFEHDAAAYYRVAIETGQPPRGGPRC